MARPLPGNAELPRAARRGAEEAQEPSWGALTLLLGGGLQDNERKVPDECTGQVLAYVGTKAGVTGQPGHICPLAEAGRGVRSLWAWPGAAGRAEGRMGGCFFRLAARPDGGGLGATALTSCSN